jgi:hypothetical protein
MTANDNPVLLFLAFAILAVFFFVLLKYHEQVAFAARVVVGIVAGLFLLYGLIELVAPIGAVVYEEYTARQCLTAYERRARALTAPDDYFGRQLREAAERETKKCAEIAAKRAAK